MSGKTVKGIAIYGIGPPLRLHTGEHWPLWRSWRDVWDRFVEIYSEFTVPQTCGPAALLYATRYGMEKEAGLIPRGSSLYSSSRSLAHPLSTTMAHRPVPRPLMASQPTSGATISSWACNTCR